MNENDKIFLSPLARSICSTLYLRTRAISESIKIYMHMIRAEVKRSVVVLKFEFHFDNH